MDESEGRLLRLIDSELSRPQFHLPFLMPLFQPIYYRPQTKLREGNVFTPVCDYVHRGRCTPPLADIPLPLTDTPWQTHPQADTPLGRYPTGRHPPGRHPPERATAADGTLPTGMHSCLKFRDFLDSC